MVPGKVACGREKLGNSKRWTEKPIEHVAAGFLSVDRTQASQKNQHNADPGYLQRYTAAHGLTL